MRATIIALLLIFASVSTVSAEWVQIKSRSTNGGIGYLINYNGACHAIAPLHVFSPSSRPTDRAELRRAGDLDSYNTELSNNDAPRDIAIARVNLPLEACPTAWKFLYANEHETRFNHAQNGRANVYLRTVLNNQVEALDAQLKGFDDTWVYFRISIQDAQRLTTRGTSGSGLFVGNELVAITSKAGDTGVMKALRAELVPQLLNMTFSLADQGDPSIETQSLAEEQGSGNARVEPTPGKRIYPEWDTGCDLLAANAADAGRHPQAFGITFEEIRPADAVPACADALKEFAGSARIQYQYARALDAGRRQKMEGISFPKVYGAFSKALAMGHVHAVVNLQLLLLDDLSECESRDKCERTYFSKLDSIKKLAPELHAMERARVYADRNLDISECGDREACNKAAVDLYLTLLGTSYENQAKAQVAVLVTRPGVKLPCQEDSTCAQYQRDLYLPSAQEGVAWVQRNLGNLLWRNRNAKSMCEDKKACVFEAIEYLEKAIDQQDSWAMYYLAGIHTNSDATQHLECNKTEFLCIRDAVSYYERATKAGHQSGHLGVTWAHLYHPDALDCAQEECAKIAFDQLQANPDFSSNWKTSLLAYGTDKFPEVFKAYCGDTSCKVASFEYNKIAAQTRSYSAEYAARQILYGGDEIDCGSSKECAAMAIDFAQKAHDMGRSTAFIYWSVALLSWLEEPDTDKPEIVPVVTLTDRTVPAIMDDSEIVEPVVLVGGANISCNMASPKCSEKMKPWLDALDDHTSKPSSYGAEQIITLLALLVAHPSDSSATAALKPQAVELFKGHATSLMAANSTDSIFTAYEFLVEGCGTADCIDVLKKVVLAAAQDNSAAAMSMLVHDSHFKPCETRQQNGCFDISQTALIKAISGFDNTDDLRMIASYAIGEPRSPITTQVAKMLKSRGDLLYEARRTRGTLWTLEGRLAANDFTQDQARTTLQTLLGHLATGEAHFANAGIANAVLAVLISNSTRKWKPSLRVDAMTLALMNSSEFKGSRLDVWITQDNFNELDISRFQGVIGAGIDGKFGPRSATDAEEWRANCTCSSEEISALASSILSRIPKS